MVPFDVKTARKAESWALTQHEQEMETAQMSRSIMRLAVHSTADVFSLRSG